MKNKNDKIEELIIRHKEGRPLTLEELEILGKIKFATAGGKEFKIERPGKGKEVFMPNEIKLVTDRFLKKRLRKDHYKGKENSKELGLVNVWEADGLEYLVKQTDLVKLKDKKPRVYVAQDKMVKLLLGLTALQQLKNEEKKAEMSFTIKDLALGMGYTPEEIRKGGKFLEEIKANFFSGGYTIFRTPYVKENGKEYIHHGAFYSIDEPKEERKGKWSLWWNGIYGKSLLKILTGETFDQKKPFFVYQLKEIADRKTLEKPYLHLFYNQLIKRKRAGLITMPKKVSNLLKDMGVENQALKSPKKSFKVLKECLVYFAINYPEELEGIKFYNNFNKEKTKPLPLRALKELESIDYNEFKDLLSRAIGVKDVRNAFISFIRPEKRAKELPVERPGSPEESGELIIEIMDWIDRCIKWEKMRDYTRSGTEKYLNDFEARKGSARLEELFREEATKAYPNAVHFLSVTLKNAMAKNR